jgi:hypothetical protein
MPAQIQQKFFVIQENSQTSSAIKAGPFYDKGSALEACQRIAAGNMGIPFVVVKSIGGFCTEAPAAVALDFFAPGPGDAPLDL